MNPYLSSIYQFGGNFAIAGFALCAGQILPISSNTALFALIGVTYGGNGSSNFGLPDLRGRSAVCQGQGAGLSLYSLGEMLGTENVTMLSGNLPSHFHTANAQLQNGTTGLPGSAYFSEVKNGSGPHASSEFFYNSGPANVALNPLSVSFSGSSIPFNIQQPELAISVMIALKGVFPARN